MQKLNIVLLTAAFFAANVELATSSECPWSNGALMKLGLNGYYIIQSKKRGDFVTQAEAKLECAKYGLELATIPDMFRLAMVSRELEKVVFKDRLRDTWYWLDAAYDEKSQQYVWKNDKANIVKYSNFLYRPPRPIGIGKHVNYKRVYQPNANYSQCLTLALPWPWPKDATKAVPIFGNQASFDERHCESRNARHALCQSKNASCKMRALPFMLDYHDFGENYFYANWIFGERKYIVNWKPRNKDDTAKYCKSLGLQVFIPGRDEKYLIPNIKMWSREITQNQFWTDLTYNPDTKQFLYPDGRVAANQTFGVNFTEEYSPLSSRQDSSNEERYCVAMSLAYELKGQMPCTDVSNPACSWSFIHYVPSNCKNYHGTICQHKNHAERKIFWPKIDRKNLTCVIQNVSVTKDFGYKGRKHVIRSTVRQQFGSFYCPPGYEVLTEKVLGGLNLLYTPKDFEEDYIYQYDLEETYWIADESGFNKISGKTDICGVVRLSKTTLEKSLEICSNWNFYLCVRMQLPTMQMPTNKTWTSTTMEWREGYQPRFMPNYVRSDYFGLEKPLPKLGNLFTLNDTLTSGRIINMLVQVLKDTQRAQISFDEDSSGDVKILHMDFIFSKHVGLNTYENGTWGTQQTNGTFPIRNGYTFEMEILCQHDRFQIYIDGKYLNTFVYRIALERIQQFNHYGGIYVAYVEWDKRNDPLNYNI